MTRIRPQIATAARGENQRTSDCAANAACAEESSKMSCKPFVARGLVVRWNGGGKHAV